MSRLIFILSMLLSTVSFAKKDVIDFSYPDSLKKGADAVMIYDNTEILRHLLSGLSEKRSIAITILNHRVDNFARMFINYNNYSEIDKFTCSIYDSFGKKVKSFKKNEIIDFSYYSDFTLYSDSSVKMVEALNPTFPYTIVFEYEKSYNGFYQLSRWLPINNYRLAVHHSSFKIKTPNDLKFTAKVIHDDHMDYNEYAEDDLSVQEWVLSDKRAIQEEEFSPNFMEIVPNICIQPSHFEFNGFKGCNNSCQEVGMFRNSLFDTKAELTEKTKTELTAIKQKSHDKRELI